MAASECRCPIFSRLIVSSVLGRAIGALIQAVTIILLARAIDPSVFGQVSAAIAMVALLLGLFDLGMQDLLSRVVAISSTDPRRDAIMGVIFVTSLSVYLLSVPPILLVFYDIFAALLLLSFSLSLERLVEAHFTEATSNSRYLETITNIIGRRTVALILFVMLSTYSGVDPLVAYGVASLSGSLLGMAFWYARGYRLRLRVRVMDAKLVLLEARPYFVSNLSGHLRALDIPIVALFAGSYTGGLYAAAARLTAPVGLLSSSVGSVVIPQVARREVSTSTALRTWSIFYALCSAAVLPVIFNSSWLIEVSVGPDYADASGTLAVLVASLPFSGFCVVASSILQGDNGATLVARINTVFVPILLIAISISSLSGNGVIVASTILCAFVIKSILMYVLISRRPDA